LPAFRKPFVPPTDASPLIVRSITYVGEKHPVTPKRVVVVPVARLPLSGPAAVHKFKLLAGVRWTPEPPKDAGVGKDEKGGEHGYIKISCEDFPKASMNLKWISDAVDRLVAEANNVSHLFLTTFACTNRCIGKR
jgi:small subunit ribosomal protein S35